LHPRLLPRQLPVKIVPPNLGSSSTDLAAITIFAPAPANFNAIAFPIPLVPPVIKTVFPCNAHGLYYLSINAFNYLGGFSAGCF
jgi:hypothetical protein